MILFPACQQQPQKKERNYSSTGDRRGSSKQFGVRYPSVILRRIQGLTETFESRISVYSERIAERLDRALPSADTTPRRLHQAMRYAVLNGGKRLRPLLVYATGECLEISPEKLDAPAVAIELIHAFSLVHDDLPAMDNDDLRRGMPTVHVKFDEATAILAADALQPLAFSVLANARALDDGEIVRISSIVANACGSLGMTGGQSIDLAAEGTMLEPTELETMHRLKTGALIEASIMSACQLVETPNKPLQSSLQSFAESIGLAFQIRDDILDVEGKTHVLGKKAGSDQRKAKATWPAVFGLAESRRRCSELLQAAMQDLEEIGNAAEPLRWLARFVVEREQ
jgi:geranylgeranyl pyrophosphate synthase